MFFARSTNLALLSTNKVAITAYLAAGILVGLAMPENPAITLFSPVAISIILAAFMASATLGLFGAYSPGDLLINPFLNTFIAGIVASAVWSWSGGSGALFIYTAGYFCLMITAIASGLLLSKLLKSLPEFGYISDLMMITLVSYYVLLGTRLMFDLTVRSSEIGTLNHSLLYLITNLSLMAVLILVLLITSLEKPVPPRRQFNQIFSKITAQINLSLPLHAALNQVFLIIRDNKLSRLAGITVGAYLLVSLTLNLDQGHFYLISSLYLAGLLAIFTSQGALRQMQFSETILAPSKIKLLINKAGFGTSLLIFGLMLLPLLWLIIHKGFVVQTGAVIYMMIGFFLAHSVTWITVLKNPRANLIAVNLLATLIAAWSMSVILGK